MKKIYIASQMFVLLVLAGCSSFLDEEPYSFVRSENFYQNSAQVEMALTGCYQILNANGIQGVGGTASLAGCGIQVMLDAPTDELCLRGIVNQLVLKPGSGEYAPDGDQIKYCWLFMNAGVYRANYLLQAIDKAQISDTVRAKEIKGEARFLRGLCYMYLAQLYGGVPVFASIPHNATAPRDPLKKVYEQIISDFKYAYTVLPQRAKIAGRANKWSSAGFLAKVYCYLASCKNNNVGVFQNFPLNSFDWVDANDSYLKAKTILSEIISGSSYKLTAKYGYQFYEANLKESREESLFSVESTLSSVPGSQYNFLYYYQIPAGDAATNGGGVPYLRPFAEFYDKYSPDDMRRAQNLGAPMVKIGTVWSTEVVNGVSYCLPGPCVVKGGTAATHFRNNNYCGTKFRAMMPSQKAFTNTYYGGSYPLLRYADILLLYAETKYFTGEPVNDARNLLVQVRQRSLAAGKTITSLNDTYFKTNFLDELLDERSRELCFEAQRRIDLIRFNKWKEKMDLLSTEAGGWNYDMVPLFKSFWDDNHIWFPLPANDIALNKNLVQNPGYPQN
jgi:hypothetical protein